MYEEERLKTKAWNEVMAYGEWLISSLSTEKGAFSSQHFETSLIITQDLGGREWRRLAWQWWHDMSSDWGKCVEKTGVKKKMSLMKEGSVYPAVGNES